jgi:hypothetical protein
MRSALDCLIVCLLASSAFGQAPMQAPSAGTTNNIDPTLLVTRIEQEANGLDGDVSKLRIDKWKTDSNSKQQASDDARSIERNITSALPELVTAVRTNPQSLAANFKLYRNVNALYDVLSRLAESTGAFGKREEYEMIGPHVAALDDARRSFGEYLQQLSTEADARLAAAAHATAQAAAQPPRKVIVDDADAEAAPKPVKKKRAAPKKPATTAPSASTPSPQ